MEAIFQMKFYCKLIMEGNFPGSPDTDEWEISEKVYDGMRNMMTLEAIRQVNKLE